MIKFLANSLTDQLGRSNFVDDAGNCIGFKEFPDGTPIMWTVSKTKVVNPLQLNFAPVPRLKDFLDRMNAVFKSVEVTSDEKLSVAEIVLYDGHSELYLYAVISGPNGLYSADMQFTPNDRKLFAEPKLEDIERKIVDIREGLRQITRNISSIESMVRALKARAEAGGKADGGAV